VRKWPYLSIEAIYKEDKDTLLSPTFKKAKYPYFVIFGGDMALFIFSI